MLKLTLQNNISFKISSLEAMPKGKECFKILKKHFTYKNPDYIEAVKWGRSTYGKEQYLTSFNIYGDEIKFLRGCEKRLTDIFKKCGIPHTFVDYTSASAPIKIFSKAKYEPREEQTEFIDTYLEHCRLNIFKQGILLAHTSYGKCHAKGTEVIMYDGSVKKVEDVVVGDSLMGVDSKPRRVLSLGKGVDTLYEIKGQFKEPFVCNSDHILSLKVIGKNSNHVYRKMDYVEMSVKEYINLPKSRKHFLKLWGTGVEFNGVKTELPPYYLGLWIGDGSKNSASITNNNEAEIVSYLKKLAEKNGLILHKQEPKDRTPNFIIKHKNSLVDKNPITKFLKKKCVVDGVKFIPKNYMINSEKNRLSLLAGIIDSDGYLFKTNNKTYEIVAKHLRLADQIAFLARSLGFAARVYKKKTHYKKNGIKIDTGFAYRIYISGDTERIPVKLKRKRASKRKMRTNPLHSCFNVTDVGVGEYFGFTLDGDGLYLLKDFTVTHNTMTGVYLANLLQQCTMVLVHTEFAQKQWINTLKDEFYLSDKDIGGAGGVFRGKIKVGKINIALYHSMSKKEINILFKDKIGFLIIDECQFASIDMFKKSITAFRPRYMLAMTAGAKDHNKVPQVYRKDGKEFIIKDICGEVLYRSDDSNTDSKVMAKIFSTRTDFYPESDHPSQMRSEMAAIKERNILIAKRAIVAHRAGRQVIIFVERKFQAAVLAKYLSKFRVELLIGNVAPKDIAELDISDKAKEILLNNDADSAFDIVKEKCLKKEVDFVIATQKGEVGLSIETLGHGIITFPVGNMERFNQIKGRLERKHKEKRLELYGEKPTPYLEVFADNFPSSINSWTAIKEVYKKDIIKNPYKKENRSE